MMGKMDDNFLLLLLLRLLKKHHDRRRHGHPSPSPPPPPLLTTSSTTRPTTTQPSLCHYYSSSQQRIRQQPRRRRRRKRLSRSGIMMIRYYCLSFLMIITTFNVVKVQASSSSSTSQQFNYEIESRVLERIQYYMGDPVSTSKIIENSLRNEVFPHDLKGLDRDLYLKLAFALSQPLVYYALEDGTIPGFYWANGYYREPGNSGYYVSNTNMTKHYKSCIDGFSGQQQDCLLEVESQYIQCDREGDDDDDNSNDDDNTGLCSKLELCPNQLHDREYCGRLKDNKDIDSCLKNLKYCRQYSIQTYEPSEYNEKRGYIPLTNFCLNPKGQFSQSSEGVIDPRGTSRIIDDENDDKLTSCTYGNGDLVKRNFTGSYAACPLEEKGCSTVFIGGYESFEYDPRYRPWYILSKEAQKPIWTPPYPFFTYDGIGVTYTRPIYEYDSITQRKIFAGVLSVDYRFDDITNFLIESYGNTTTAIAIYEKEAPNYLIATSTGSSSVKLTLDSDPTKPCPPENDAAAGDGSGVKCSPQRISIFDLVGDSPLDAALVNAAYAHQDNGYPKDLLSIKGANDEGFYVSQSALYDEQEGNNLSWRIVIVAPGSISTADTILPGDATFVAILCIASVGVIVCMLFLCAMVSNRKEKAFIFADWRFTGAFIMGCVLLNCSTYTLIGRNTDSMCLLRMWSFHLCFAVALAPLFVKIWRINSIVGGSVFQQQRRRSKRYSITNTKASLMTLPMILGQAIILLIFTFVDPPKRTEVISTNDGGLTQQTFICDTETNGFLITSLIYEAGFVLIGCVLAYLSRNLHDDFGETKQMIFAMYNVAFVGCMTVLISQIAEIDVAGQYIIQGIGVFWGSALSAAAFVVPRLVQVQQTNNTNIRGEESSSKYQSSRVDSTCKKQRSPSMLSKGNVRVSGLFHPDEMIPAITPAAEDEAASTSDTPSRSNELHEGTERMGSSEMNFGVGLTIKESTDDAFHKASINDRNGEGSNLIPRDDMNDNPATSKRGRGPELGSSVEDALVFPSRPSVLKIQMPGTSGSFDPRFSTASAHSIDWTGIPKPSVISESDTAV